jgi:hypothetical protein
MSPTIRAGLRRHRVPDAVRRFGKSRLRRRRQSGGTGALRAGCPLGAGRADVEAHGGDGRRRPGHRVLDANFGRVYASATTPDGGVGSRARRAPASSPNLCASVPHGPNACTGRPRAADGSAAPSEQLLGSGLYPWNTADAEEVLQSVYLSVLEGAQVVRRSLRLQDLALLGGATTRPPRTADDGGWSRGRPGRRLLGSSPQPGPLDTLTSEEQRRPHPARARRAAGPAA